MLAYLFVIISIAVRFLFAPVSFSPLTASLLFFGSRMPRKRAWIPLVMTAGADIVLTTVVYGYRLSPEHLFTWAWYAAVLGVGSLLDRNSSPLRLAVAAIASSVSFFIVSNFAVWASWEMYPKNLDGLVMCYVAALPFFRTAFVADLFYTAVLFSIPGLLIHFGQLSHNWHRRSVGE